MPVIALNVLSGNVWVWFNGGKTRERSLTVGSSQAVLMVKQRFVLRIEDVTLSFSVSDVSRYHRINDKSPPRAYPAEIAPQSRRRDGRYIFATKTSLLGAGFRALSILTHFPFRLCHFTILPTPPSMGA